MSYNNRVSQQQGEKLPSRTFIWQAERGTYAIILSVYGFRDNRKGTVSVNKITASATTGTGALVYEEIARKSGVAIEMKAYAEKVASDPSIILMESEEL